MPTEPLTLRERLEYGDGRTPACQRRARAREQNLLGKLYRHHDEAGLSTCRAYDFKGNVLENRAGSSRDAPILAVFNGASQLAGHAFRVDWEPPAGTTLAACEGPAGPSRLPDHHQLRCAEPRQDASAIRRMSKASAANCARTTTAPAALESVGWTATPTSSASPTTPRASAR